MEQELVAHQKLVEQVILLLLLLLKEMMVEMLSTNLEVLEVVALGLWVIVLILAQDFQAFQARILLGQGEMVVVDKQVQ